jgi:hypothetical protein
MTKVPVTGSNGAVSVPSIGAKPPMLKSIVWVITAAFAEAVTANIENATPIASLLNFPNTGPYP